MNSFKHPSNFRKTDLAQDIMAQFGLHSYAWLLILIEIVVSRWDGLTDPHFKFRPLVLRVELGVSQVDLDEFLAICEQHNFLTRGKIDGKFALLFSDLYKFVEAPEENLVSIESFSPDIQKWLDKVPFKLMKAWFNTHGEDYVNLEIRNAYMWNLAQPARSQKKHIARFLTAWLARSQCFKPGKTKLTPSEQGSSIAKDIAALCDEDGGKDAQTKLKL